MKVFKTLSDQDWPQGLTCLLILSNAKSKQHPAITCFLPNLSPNSRILPTLKALVPQSLPQQLKPGTKGLPGTFSWIPINPSTLSRKRWTWISWAFVLLFLGKNCGFKANSHCNFLLPHLGVKGIHFCLLITFCRAVKAKYKFLLILTTYISKD